MLLLAEETTESKELVRCREPNAAISINEDSGKQLDGIKVQIFSAGGKSSVLLDEIKSESKESASCGEPSEDYALKIDADTLVHSSQSTDENVTPETADDGKESDGDKPHDDDFSADDLLRFAWQIAQGMVNKVRLFESHSKTES